MINRNNNVVCKYLFYFYFSRSRWIWIRVWLCVTEEEINNTLQTPTTACCTQGIYVCLIQAKLVITILNLIN